MRLCFIFCIVTLATVNAAPRLTPEQVNSGDLTDEWSQSRIKRSIFGAGAAALRMLLENAKFLYASGIRSGRERYYMRPGGFDQALKDFDTFKIPKPKTSMKGGRVVKQTGSIDDMQIVVQRGQWTGNTKMTVTTKDKPGKDILVYPD